MSALKSAFAGGADMAFCGSNVGVWHFSDLARSPTWVRKVGQSGLDQVAVTNRDFMSTRPSIPLIPKFRIGRGREGVRTSESGH